MTFDRQFFKKCARQQIHEGRRKILITSACYVLLIFILSTIILNVTGYTKYIKDFMLAYEETTTEFMESLETMDPDTQLNYEFPLKKIEFSQVSPMAWVLAVALYIFTSVLEAGFDFYCLCISREGMAPFRSLFTSFNMFTKVFIIKFLKALSIGVGLLFFVIPGIFAAYRFRMAIYVMYDNPDFSPVMCLKRSSQIMKGFSSELFILDLSFIGWFVCCEIVSTIGLPLLDIWVQPYRGLTNAHYYNSVIGYQTKQTSSEEATE